MRLPRRAFLGLMAGFAATMASVSRALSWPLRWLGASGNTHPQDAPSPATAAGDSSLGVKITTIPRDNKARWSSDVREDPDIFYIQGDLRRWERRRSYTGQTNPDGSVTRKYGPHIVTIVRPDLGKMFELNVDAFEYTEATYPPEKPKPLSRAQMEARGIKLPPKTGDGAKPTFRIITTTKDTGERKEMFGYLARRVITTRKEIPLEGSRRSAQESVTDAWYIDLEPQFYPTIYPRRLMVDESGKPRPVHAFVTAYSLSSPAAPEIPEFMDIGEAETGFPVEEVRTSRSSYASPDGMTRQTESESEKVVTVERATYDRALFEVPRGFKRFSRIQPNPF